MFVMRRDVQLKMRKTPADLLGAHPCLAWELIVETLRPSRVTTSSVSLQPYIAQTRTGRPQGYLPHIQSPRHSNTLHNVLHLLDPLPPRRPPLHPRLRHLPFRRRRRRTLHALRTRSRPFHPPLRARHCRRSPMGPLDLLGQRSHVPQAHRQVPKLLHLVLDNRGEHAVPTSHTAAR